MRTLLLTLTACVLVLPAYAKYSGGTGEPNDPYQIATAADLIALGNDPNDYDKHFILTADIDLDPNLPGRKVFDKAVIAPNTDPVEGHYRGTPFTGVFDGNSHTISHLTITGQGCLGLFGRLESWPGVKSLGILDVNITGSGSSVGGLVGANHGRIATSYSTGAVRGGSSVGGLVGSSGYGGSVTHCYSTATVSATLAWQSCVGGLVGSNLGTLTQCYSTGRVSGGSWVGGLVGEAYGGSVTYCYSTGSVTGAQLIGGLVGHNYGTLTHCYSTGAVSGQSDLGGLVGSGAVIVFQSVWDMDTSGLLGSVGGVGLTTAEMMDPCMLGLNGFASDPNWVLDAGRDYPRLAWQGTAGQIIPDPNLDWLQGCGTGEDPYRINTAEELIMLGRAGALWGKHFVLGANIDLDPNLPGRQTFRRALIQTFTGVFDGNGHAISHLMVKGESYLGLFGDLEGGDVKNLGVMDVNITGSGASVGGLVGYNSGAVTQCHSTGVVSGALDVGGLVGGNYFGTVTGCYSTGAVDGSDCVGGLVGENFEGAVAHCYSTGSVSGEVCVGGLVGDNRSWGGPATVTGCYSTGPVSGEECVGGLIGLNESDVTACFWDIQNSGQTWSAGGTGKTTAEMQTAKTFLDAGWDFVDEMANGTADIWWILEGKDYPRLWWEGSDEAP